MGELKHRGHFSTTVPIWQIDSIRKLSTETKIPISRLTEEAFDYLLTKYGIVEKKNLPG
ncbi:ribbon-helix-helix domain-containing protein [Pelosinus sp. UFO1]|uniref:ribbon-helix-helix domain-containing protein n=1 Tax=Pelosinus sp. UFO1 TaxID=484770 RepID=UPI0004D1B8DB|nr:ribbon-helix-helix domain-containing protein [Pelosinus sp. UFO1]AIF52050.1 hypothetical protein UFO1_2503 [Pelosinus sp. UFO1]